MTLTLGLTSATHAADLAVINLINLPSDNSAEIYYAQELGFFKDAGLDVRVTSMTNSGAIVAALAGGGGDIGNSVVGSVADARSKGIPILYIAPAGLYDAASPTAALVTIKDSPIKKAADLNGKVVAVSGLLDLTHFATRNWIDQNGGNSASVKFIELPFPAMAAAVVQHRVDAAYVIEPFYTAVTADLQILGRAAAQRRAALSKPPAGLRWSRGWHRTPTSRCALPPRSAGPRFGRMRITKNRPRSWSSISNSIRRSSAK